MKDETEETEKKERQDTKRLMDKNTTRKKEKIKLASPVFITFKIAIFLFAFTIILERPKKERYFSNSSFVSAFQLSSSSHRPRKYTLSSMDNNDNNNIIINVPEYIKMCHVLCVACEFALRCVVASQKTPNTGQNRIVRACVRRKKHKRALSQYNTLYKALLNYTI